MAKHQLVRLQPRVALLPSPVVDKKLGTLRVKRITGRAGVERRERIKRRDSFTCQRCGVVTTELHIDHVVPLAISHDETDENLQSLCHQCHALKTAQEAKSRASSLPEWLGRPLIPLIAVCGPPGSGKSTWIAENRRPEDLVLDVDEIASRMTGKPLHTHTHEEVGSAIRYRNTALGKLARYAPYARCLLVVSASTPKARKFWTERATQLIVLDPGAEECERRILADATRPRDATARMITAAHAWYRGPTPVAGRPASS